MPYLDAYSDSYGSYSDTAPVLVGAAAFSVVVEVAFASQPLDPAPMWTDVTRWLLRDTPIQIDRGRPDEFTDTQPGTASFRLNNSDGRFTRGLASSPYFPGVRNGRRVRITGYATSKNWVPNSSFEANLFGWEPGGSAPPTLASSTAHHQDGARAMLITWATDGAFPQAQTTISGLRIGRAYTASAYAYVPAGQPAMKLAVGDGPVGDPSTTTDTFERVTVSFIAAATTASLQVWPDTAPTSGQTGYVDAVQVELGGTATTFDPTPPLVTRRFDGHVNQWPTGWASPKVTFAPASITASDRLQRFGRIGEVRSMLEEETLRDAVTVDASHGGCYYPLGEPSGAVSAGSITTQVQGAASLVQVGVGGDVQFGSGTGPGTDGLSAVVFEPVSAAAGQYLEARLTTGVGSSVTGLTLECWFAAEATTAGRAMAILADDFDSRISLNINSGGLLQAQGWHGGFGQQFSITGPTVVNDTATHHGVVTVTILPGGNVLATLWQDNAKVGFASYVIGRVITATHLYLGGDPWRIWGLYAGTLSHVAGHSALLSADRIGQHYHAGVDGLAGERTDQRVSRVADWIGIPIADRALDVGASLIGGQATSGQQPIEVMRQAAHLESGPLYISGDGKLTFHARTRRYNVVPAMTLDVDAGYVLADLSFPGDDLYLLNDYTVSRPGGSPARAVDEASIAEYGLYRDSAELPANSDNDVAAAASWRMNNYSEPLDRVPTVSVQLARITDGALLQQLLTAEISTKVRLTNLPAQAPASMVDLFVEGVSEAITPETWTISYATAPAGLSTVWQLGVAGFSELGVTTKLAL